MSRDIVAQLTEKVENLTAQLQRSEQAGEVKTEYLEKLHHEIRTSMNGIVGMTELLFDTELNTAQQRYLEMITSSVDKLLAVIDEVLDFSRIESGQLDLQPDFFTLKKSLDHDLYLLRLEAEHKGMRLVCDIDPDVPEHLWGDVKRLVQVLTNLVHNAVRYSEKGQISIRVSNEGYDSQNRVILSFTVRDTGSGIDIDRQKKIFNTFCHHNPCQTVSCDGAGIGLALSAWLVHHMDGDIGLASSGEGSLFWFTVPFKEMAALEERYDKNDTRQEDPGSSVLNGISVLLAEDEFVSQVLIETLLRQAGAEVRCVENGAEAITAVQSGSYQVVLMDVQMPVVDGIEATRQIRALEDESKRGIIIIALSAVTTQDRLKSCFQAGMDDYLEKPLKKELLYNVLRHYLTRTALVVDNDVESRRQLVRTLVKQGWKVTMAETSRTAMYEATLNRFDLILFDIQMPRIDGLHPVEVIRKLEEYSGGETTILGIGSEKECRGVPFELKGFDSMISRPITEEELQDILATFT